VKALVSGAGRRLVRPAAMAIAAGALFPAAASAAHAKTYIVQLKAAPVASYQGGRTGLQATSPEKTGARRVQLGSVAVRDYRSFLAGRQRRALDRVPGKAPKVDYSYRIAFSGFAAELSQAQVAALRGAPEVANVWEDEKFKPQADPDLGDVSAVNLLLDDDSGFGDSAAYLDLPEGLWDTLGGPDQAGEDVIVGDIDTGITPQHPSFADDPADGYLGSPYTAPPARWGGTCDTGDDPIAPDPADFCNDKLIGARFFVSGFGATHVADDSFLSPRDDDGHGTHTASTAAGNFGVDPEIDGNDLGVDRISGIAPRARIAAYKICWVGGDVADGCSNADSVAAIEAAVSDGVDVINYSVGGTTSNVIDAVEYAYLGASDAGVFVANSAGNAGPGAGTVGTPTTVPWLTSVAADNPARTFLATVTVTPSSGAPLTIKGVSVTGASPTAPLADAASSAKAGVTAADAELCQDATLDPAKVTGKIVICRRGGNDRINKSKNVQAAGGVGMILYNPNAAQDQNTDTHWVPTAHVSLADGTQVKAAAAAPGGATAQIGAGTAALGQPRSMAAFSSRGPQTAVPDLPKPDVTAPGVNILAGMTPDPSVNTDLRSGFLFQSISGTSMAAPHVAGAAALLKDLHPAWSPAAIKSALMTTANPDLVKEDNTTPATPLDQGSGEIDPNAAADPGAVFEATTADYLGYLRAVDPEDFGAANPIQPSDVNLASIGNGKVAGTFSTTRTLTSVAAEPRRWTADVSVPGFAAQVAAGSAGFSTFDLAPGASQTLTVSVRRTTAAFGEWAFGALTLTSGQTTLRLPISLRAIPVAAPDAVKVTTDQGAGSQAVAVKAGFAGTLTGLGWGLAAPSTRAGETISTDADGLDDPNAPDAGNKVYDVTVPEGAQLLSGRIANVDAGDANTDLDLFLYHDANGDGTYAADELYDQSASAVATEGVTEVVPDAGSYRFVIVGFTTKSPSTYDFSTWLVDDGAPDDAAGGPGITVGGDPFTTAVGQTVTPALNWANVDQAGLYLGVATFHDSASPAAGNIQGASVVELTKTADTTTPGGGGGPTPTPTPAPTVTPSPSPTPQPQALAFKIRKAVLEKNRRTLNLRVTLGRTAKVSVKATRKGRTAASAKARTITAGNHSRSFRLSHRLLRTRTYKVTVTAKAADGATTRRTLTVKAARKKR
jgi:subtilisin family serine protease